MTILYIHQYFVFPEDPGGTRSYDLATSFVRKGYKVEVITSSGFIRNIKFTNRWTLIKRDGLKIHVLDLGYSNNLSLLRRSLVFVQFLFYSSLKLLSIKGDLVLATSTPLTIGIPPLVNKWINKTPFIFEVRDVWPEAVIAIGAIKNELLKKILFFLEKTIYKNAAAVVPLSDDMRHSIISRYPKLQSRPIEVIENISSIDRFTKNNEVNSRSLKDIIGVSPRFAILYAGTFGRVNGIEYVIRLANSLLGIDPSIVFILVGNGAEKQKIIKLAEETGVLQKNVFILDATSKQDLPLLYSEVSMGSSFVIDIPELWANSANKFFDTLAAGRPVLINHLGWQSDVINNNNIGFVLPRVLDDKEVKRFAKYTRNDKLIENQKKNASQIAKTKYSLDVAVNKYIAIFNVVLQKT